MLEVKTSIEKLDKSSYATEDINQSISSDVMDCSNGINPFGMSDKVESSFKEFDVRTLNKYPKPATRLKNLIREYWSDVSQFEEKQIILGNGSMELIYKINKLFIDDKSFVLGYSPQFSDFVDDVRAYGAIYESYILDKSNNFQFNSTEYMDKMSSRHSLFYLDNPNNPTGQLIDIKDLEAIVKKASDLNRPVIIDEAYGDFVRKEDSAISLVGKYTNLIIIRTFSKGLGLAGLRAGYIITSSYISIQYQKISNPFEMNSLARHITEEALRDEDFMIDSRKKVVEYKEKFKKTLRKLHVLETNKSVPIMTLMHPDKEIDLEKLLMESGILTVSGKGFLGLGKNSVRLMINADIDTLIEKFKKIEDEINWF